MKNLWHAADRAELQQRAQRLTPNAAPAWGRMNAPEMVAHVTDQLRMTLGRLHAAQIAGMMRWFPIKQLLIYWVPWPKGAPTIPELRTRAPGVWGNEIADLSQLIDDFGRCDAREPWPVHARFGTLTPRAWGRLGYKHLNHHFTQFRV
jgi:hypothetical protein